MKIALYTTHGDYIHDEEIPDFNKPPDVIAWGLRIFHYNTNQGFLGKEPHEYREAFTYYLPTTSASGEN